MHRINRSNRKFNRSQRRRYQDSDDDVVNIDWAKPLNQIAHEILQHLIRIDNLPKHQLLAYLNCFTKYCLKRTKERSSLNGLHSKGQSLDALLDNEDDQKCDVEPEAYTDFEVLSCLRPCLLYEANEVRAASLRAIRYYVQTKKALHCLLELNLQHLIARSLDIVLENRIERIQSLRLIRHMLFIDPTIFPLALARCLCAIASDNSLEKDMLLRACWATIAELTTVNAIVSARAGCVGVMTRCVMNSAIFTTTNVAPIGEICMGAIPSRDRNQANNGSTICMGSCTSAMVTSLSLNYSNVAISEAVLTSFLHLYNWPDTRRLLQPKGSDLFYFISPFTDTYAFLHASNAARNNVNPFQVDVIEQIDNLQPAVEQKDGKPFQGGGQNRQAANKQQQQNVSHQVHVNFEYRTIRYLACKNALLSILRSWPGMFFMCRTMVLPGSGYSQSTRLGSSDNTWDYSEIYRQTGEHNMRSLLDSLRFFGISEEMMPTKVTQMVSDIGKAIDTNSQQTSSYFTTTSYGSKNPLESLISIFHLPYPEVHRHLLELVFELFGIKPPDWLDDFDEAVRCVYFTLVNKRTKYSKQGNILASFESTSTCPLVKSYFPEEWQLYEGFVAKEAEHILPSRCTSRLNFITNYYALLLQTMVENGLLEALVSVILDSHEKPAVNLATILLGELLHLSGKYLPASTYAHRCQSLPTLVAASISDCKTRRNRALTAITHLNEIHELKKRGPKPASLYLEQQLYFCQTPTPPPKANVRKISVSFTKNHDDSIVSLIKSTLVLKKSSFKDWNWDVITDILKHPGESLRKLDDKDHHRLFIRRLVDFFRPSRRLFSLVSKNSSLLPPDLTAPPNQAPHTPGTRSDPIYIENPRLLCIAASALVDFLLDADESRASEFIEDFLVDVDLSFKNIATKSPSADESLLPSRLLSTLSHHYFLLIGRFTHSAAGRRWLEKTHIYQYMLDLINLATNDIYIKLIVSSLDYSEASLCRTLLSKVLTATPDSSRIYATRYLRVLHRAGASHFSQWAIDCLVVQLYDRCPAVSLAALDILDEACAEDESCLEKVISHRPTMFHLGDLGIIFFTRFASHPCGLSYLKESNMLENELSRWHTVFTGRYVRMVEDSLNECFSVHQRSDYGTFGRRSDRRHFPHPKRVSTTTFVLPHLYGQLVQTEEGFAVLRDRVIVPPLIKLLRTHIDELTGDIIESDENNNSGTSQRLTEATVLRVKAALWSIGHICTTEAGFSYIVDREEPIMQWICTLCRRCPVLSLRATCFYVLCLISSTPKGCQLLSEFGWAAIQHSHDENFPINQLEYDSFYFNGRPRFMSDPEKDGRSRDTIVSIGSTPFFMTIDEISNEQVVNSSRHYSQSSSRSSSSSYLSMQAHQSRTESKADKITPEEHKLSFTMSSSSSSTSIYSNTSSVGCLMSNTMSTTSYNRPRSSSDCVPTINNKVIGDSRLHAKPDGQDSGILEITGNSKGSLAKVEATPDGNKPSVLPARSRKISAPCLALSLEGSRETRSDSNDSSRTANLYSSSNSRSTSFAEYSTSSSGSNMLDPPKVDRNVSFSPDSATLEEDIELNSVHREGNIRSSRRIDRHVPNRQLSLMMHPTDDPYPSPVDAHGYAQLRAIQKRRVQSLSGNMFFSGMGNSNGGASEQFNFESEFGSKSKRPHSNSVKSDEMPEILITDPNANSMSGGRLRKISHVSLPSTSPIDSADLKRMLRIPSANSIDDSIQSKLINRSYSRVSKGSFQSVDSVGTMGLGDLSLGDSLSTKSTKNEKAQFMCLCLPDSLSLIFHIDEESLSIPKAKRVQFSNELEQTIESKSEPSQKASPYRKTSTVTRPCISQLNAFERRDVDGLELHTDLKCISCCIRQRQTEHQQHKKGFDFNRSSSHITGFGTHLDFNNDKMAEYSKFKVELNQQQQMACNEMGIDAALQPTLSQRPSLTSSSIAPSTCTIQQRKEVLRLVSNLSAAMYAKQSEQGLLSIKQRYPTVFEDFCLFSEVCLMMESVNYRAPARRFLHELFDENLLLPQLYRETEVLLKHRQCN